MSEYFEGVIEVKGIPFDLKAFVDNEMKHTKKTSAGIRLGEKGSTTFIDFVGSEDVSYGVLNLRLKTKTKLDMELFRELSSIYNVSFDISVAYSPTQQIRYMMAGGEYKEIPGR